MRGVKVLELSASGAAAYAARLFASGGADVVMVEPAAGSPLRSAPPWLEPAGARQDARSAVHEYLNAYKRSVVVPEGTDGAVAGTVDALLRWADVVISSADGDVAACEDRHRLISRANPDAVHAVISGFGLTGRWSAWRTSDLVDWAAGGHLYITGEPTREPVQGGGPWNSYLTGATAAVGAQAALFGAKRGRGGRLVDVGAMEATAAAHQWTVTMYTHTGAVKRRWANRHGESHHPLSLYPCADGWVCIGAPSREQWENLCIAIDRVELLADDRLYAPAERFDRADEIDEHLNPWLAPRKAADVVAELQERRVPASRVLTMAELVEDAQLEARAYWARPEELGPAARMPVAPFRVGPEVPFRPAPRLGEHTAEVLAEAGVAEVRAGTGEDR